MSPPYFEVELFTAVPAILRASQDLVPCSNRYNTLVRGKGASIIGAFACAKA